MSYRYKDKKRANNSWHYNITLLSATPQSPLRLYTHTDVYTPLRLHTHTYTPSYVTYYKETHTWSLQKGLESRGRCVKGVKVRKESGLGISFPARQIGVWRWSWVELICFPLCCVVLSPSSKYGLFFQRGYSVCRPHSYW